MTVPRSTLERLAAYSDAIMAVVATLLVLGIAVPEDHRFSEDGLLAFLARMRGDLMAYALSFLIITSYWMQHHVIFLFMNHANRTFTWLNFVFLFFVTLIPFATKLIAVYHQEMRVVLIYGVLQVACGFLLCVLWWYANRHRQMMAAAVDPLVARSMTVRLVLGPIINLAAVLASVASVRLALLMFMGAPLLNLSHRRVDRSFRDSDATSDHEH